MLTTYNIHEAVYRARRAGASGFILKDAVPRELAVAIAAVAVGDAWLDPAVTKELIAEFAARPDNRTPTPADMERLTPSLLTNLLTALAEASPVPSSLPSMRAAIVSAESRSTPGSACDDLRVNPAA